MLYLLLLDLIPIPLIDLHYYKCFLFYQLYYLSKVELLKYANNEFPVVDAHLSHTGNHLGVHTAAQLEIGRGTNEDIIPKDKDPGLALALVVGLGKD